MGGGGTQKPTSHQGNQHASIFSQWPLQEKLLNWEKDTGFTRTTTNESISSDLLQKCLKSLQKDN